MTEAELKAPKYSELDVIRARREGFVKGRKTGRSEFGGYTNFDVSKIVAELTYPSPQVTESVRKELTVCGGASGNEYIITFSAGKYQVSRGGHTFGNGFNTVGAVLSFLALTVQPYYAVAAIIAQLEDLAANPETTTTRTVEV